MSPMTILRTCSALLLRDFRICPGVSHPDAPVSGDSEWLNHLHSSHWVEMTERAPEEDPAFRLEWTEGYERLLGAWQRLAVVGSLDATVLRDVFIVLIETLPAPGVESPEHPPQLDSQEEKRTYRATAAHPRAYRGTRDRPPKRRGPERVDLRPYLISNKNRNAVLTRLRHFCPDAQRLLVVEGYLEDKVDTLQIPVDGNLDCYWSYHRRDPGSAPIAMSHELAALFLPAMISWTSSRIHEVIGAWRLLEIDNSRRDFMAPFYAFTICIKEELFSPAAGLIASAPEDERLWLMIVLSLFGLKLDEATLPTVDDLNRLRSGPDDLERWRQRVCYFVEALCHGLERSYLFTGLEFVEVFEPDRQLKHLIPCSNFDPDPLHRFFSRYSYSGDHAIWFGQPLEYWIAYGALPGFGDVIRDTDWQLVRPQDALSFVDALVALIEDESDLDDRLERWSVIRPGIPELFERFTEVPQEYREKFCRAIDIFHWYWADADESVVMLPLAYRLASRFCFPPFGTHIGVEGLLARLIYDADSEQRDRIEQIPDSILRVFDESARLENDTKLIRDGLIFLVRRQHEFVLQCAHVAARSLLKTSKLLGTVSEPNRDSVLQRALEDPVWKADWSRLKPRGLLELLPPEAADGQANPVPRKLREFVAGKRDLTPTQVDRAVAIARSGEHETKLSVIARGVDLALVAGYRLESESVPHGRLDRKTRHALQVARSADDNRRVFRRFLKAFMAGHRDFLRSHPKNMGWFERHPDLDMDGWLAGPAIDFDSSNGEVIRISMESDPLEALQLGTYVGSCLGLGGVNMYSAVAVVLDANKQVLYARDKKGKLLHRQLVAISKSGELVCFDLYPANASAAVEAAFRAYGVQLSEALSIPLLGAGETYEVEELLANEWYDDGAWQYSGRRKKRSREQ